MRIKSAVLVLAQVSSFHTAGVYTGNMNTEYMHVSGTKFILFSLLTGLM